MPPPLQSAYKRIAQPTAGENGYQARQSGKSEILPICWNGFNGKPLESNVQLITMPANWTEKIPAVLSWSFYGKKYSTLDMLPMTTWQCCVKPSELSGLEKFEGLDPQIWCPQGYAIVSVDTRGAGHSDGQICVMGSQDAEDGYDVVEAVARMDWCKMEMLFCRRGWFSMSNFALIAKAIVRGPENSGLEDFEEIYCRSPVSSAFWEDKRADISRVQCPVSIRGVPEPTTELALFFDRYLREKDNRWEETPKVRWSALQFGDREAIDDIVLEDFPVPTTEYKEFFLGDNKLLSPSHSLTTQRNSYDSEERHSFAEFNYTFDKPA
ncbi:hypothetical protein N7451_001376 [Penicillium sp. IBT 35674x]|nr:hypothetical protein N7451_001376 [Penicillium sp. IBT 35674x]